ncbi:MULTISPECIES: hypothetical protein [Staphylococcus]|uniref:ABC transporter permease n=1 Tax=Staphylococcus hsinchuensis TaxID=3051183 RepID=A0ABZ3ED93_9STAP|nr:MULTISPECIES: hypothetical protein [unclassified Staphylococcus]
MSQKQHLRDFEHTLTHEPLHRVMSRGKKKRSWISLIIQFIVLILVTISVYSMFKDPIFKLVFVDKTINFHQLTDFQNTMNDIGNLNLNIQNIDNLQQVIDQLIIVFYAFFIAGIISIILTILTMLFNRTALKILNFFIIAIMFVITFGFSYLINNIANRIADKINEFSLSVKPDQIVTQSNAIHNAFILLICALALLFISLFFRNRSVH